MKKRGLLIWAVLMLFMLAACTNQAANIPSPTPGITGDIPATEDPQMEKPQTEEPDGNYATTGESRILIAYFSSAGNIATDETVQGNVGKGNTRLIAELIHEQVDGDLFFIETADKYPANYRETIDVAMQELRSNARPALASHVENMDEYNVIFLGYPIWWQALPQAVFTFLEEYDFSGKTVIPFCTYEDSGVGRSIQSLETALPDSTLLKEFSVSEHDLEDAEEAVKQWLSDLNLPE